MLRTDSPRYDSAAPSICLVAPTSAGVNGSIDQQMLQLVQALTAAGWCVHILWCDAGTEAAGQSTRTVAAAQWRLADFDFPATLALNGPYSFDALHQSDRVLHALRQLHERHHFEEIQLPQLGGLGFRAIQAKETGLAFRDVRLSVTSQGCSSDCRCSREQWLKRPEDLTLEYMERYSLAHADHHKPEALTRDPAFLGCASGSRPLVTICVPYYNLPDHLEETLTSLACQSYSNLEVFVINDGSTDGRANEVFQSLQSRLPQFRFVEQANAGIGATRNRGLKMARGEYFLPVDADNIADLHMVSRFVSGMQHNRDIAAMTCYFLAFRDFADLIERRFLYAYKPVGGPRVLGCWQNVFGDGNAMLRTDALRDVGGFETDRDTSFEDWEVLVKLTNAGHRVEVLPDFLFYYRHREAGFSRMTNAYRNRQRVLRRFREIESLPDHERALLWDWLVGSQERLAELEMENQALKSTMNGRHFRAANRLASALRQLQNSTNRFFGR